MLKYALGIFLFVLFSGCAAVPPIQEVSLPSQTLSSLEEKDGGKKLVIFNGMDVSSILSSSKYSSRINVHVNGKGVGQLKLREYLILTLEPGEHTINLLHKDLFDYKSEHKIYVEGEITYLKVYTTLFSNGAKITQKPEYFDDRFSPAYPP